MVLARFVQDSFLPCPGWCGCGCFGIVGDGEGDCSDGYANDFKSVSEPVKASDELDATRVRVLPWSNPPQLSMKFTEFSSASKVDDDRKESLEAKLLGSDMKLRSCQGKVVPAWSKFRRECSKVTSLRASGTPALN